MIKDIKLKEWYEQNKDRKDHDIAKILDVEYAHVKLKDKSDLYFTRNGLPFMEFLKPENFWTDKKWLDKNSKRLAGSSSVHKVQTKQVQGKHKDIVVKWNRMGQDIPGAEHHTELLNAEFNSPFEEISLVMELKNAMINSLPETIIHKPLAIYVRIIKH